MNHTLIRFSLVTASLLALGCSAPSAPPLGGTFTGMATTPLPSPPLPPGDLAIDATLRLDEATGTFELDMDLAALGLVDVMNVRGSYVAANGILTLTPTGFDPASTNVWSFEGGAACMTLAGFVDTPVCFTEHDSEYTVVGDELSFTLSHNIAGVDGTTPMVLTRVP